jgi:hypothetical protein
MSRHNLLTSDIVGALVKIGRRSDLDALEPDDIPAVIREVDVINRLGPQSWLAVSSVLPVEDAVSLFKALVIVERVLHWSGGSVAAAIWVFRDLEQRDWPLSRSWADWALPRTRNGYVPFGRMTAGAKSVAEAEEHWAQRRRCAAEHVVRERLQQEEALRRKELRRQAHHQRMDNQHRDVQTRQTTVIQLQEVPAPERLHWIANDDAHCISFYPDAFADVSDDDLAALHVDVLQKLERRTAQSGLPGWKRLYKRLVNRDK